MRTFAQIRVLLRRRGLLSQRDDVDRVPRPKELKRRDGRFEQRKSIGRSVREVELNLGTALVAVLRIVEILVVADIERRVSCRQKRGLDAAVQGLTAAQRQGQVEAVIAQHVLAWSETIPALFLAAVLVLIEPHRVELCRLLNDELEAESPERRAML